MENDYLQYYDLEKYLFTTVHDRFHKQGSLGCFDFFCIIIWKANRAKSKIARRILAQYPGSIENAISELTAGIFNSTSEKEKLKYLVHDCGFRIPMASAILTVLYPEIFTIYDVRVCDSLSKFHNIANISNFDRLWEDYTKFKLAVIETYPTDYTLRDKDRYLWGKSFATQLEMDLKKYEIR